MAMFSPSSLMFWTDWGTSPKIERSTMHGDDRRAIVSSDLRWPNGITIDVTGSKIYWTDAGKDRIEASNFDGSSRQVGSCSGTFCMNSQLSKSNSLEYRKNVRIAKSSNHRDSNC